MRLVIPGATHERSAENRVDKGNSRDSRGLVPFIPTPYIYGWLSIYLIEMTRGEGILDRAGPFAYHGKP